ncbi:MAG: methyltransferase [Flavobacteriales bacterium CG_4_9_14_3_um_filter_40_17]|nr:MAG: methyltransferase [Flavobacteriales bacterium CG_4_9_14_3_um_filter_40_17]
MHFISDDLEDYIATHSETEPVLLAELNKETHLKVLQPRMLSGHIQGRLLSLLSKLVQPKYILEVGTYTGYSALCLAEGLQADGELHTLDVNEELVSIQQKYFQQSIFGKQIKAHLGNALEIIPKLDFHFDLAFIDADKPNYSNYFDLILPKMNKGGIILSDNVLWSGKVVEPLIKSDKSTASILAYNKRLKEDSRVETIMLPIRDGLTVCRVL